ncbi:MAG: hypothetical protein IKE64_11225 [Thermoguttaceae bacterium]|nr:hypothetical protein [Thermoguttaceae bacterium]
MVQSPEPCNPKSTAYQNGYATIAEIGKERIRRAGEMIKRENPQIGEALDIGFRVLKLGSAHLDDDGNIIPDRLDEDLLFWVMNTLGLDLSSCVQKQSVDGQIVYVVGKDELVACFGMITRKITNSIVRRKPKFACYFGAGLTEEAGKHMREAFGRRSPDTVIKVI